ncbi:hypothetical protein [Streptomyces atratus]|uniref:hypothetical protein n=1 Tax=Streptomyces atratus TaxID=1893 RepID=UPI0033CB5426
MKRARIALVAAVASALFATGALTATASDVPPPPADPEWVTTNGRVDESLMPSEMPVVGSDGEILTDTAGDPITVDPRSGDPEFEPIPRCGRCPDTEEPPVDAGDTHSVTTNTEGIIEESVDVTDDSPLVP